ncbi:MAG: hypothetical protein IKW90_07450 [Lachnospiraceae bacterium]|nr:hypothetical protein [Lachnospiraceae bacterium]
MGWRSHAQNNPKILLATVILIIIGSHQRKKEKRRRKRQKLGKLERMLTFDLMDE